MRLDHPLPQVYGYGFHAHIIQRIQDKVKCISAEDLADIRQLRLGDIQIHPDDAIIFVFSHGWRKGLFFDLGPLQGGNRSYDLSTKLAACYAHVLWSHLFKITDEQWTRFFNQGWFPFIALPGQLIRDMTSCMESGGSIDEYHLDDICNHVSSSVKRRLTSWAHRPVFSEHAAIIHKAVDEFDESDFISAVSILYPRIEGVIRSVKGHYDDKPPQRGKEQRDLARWGAGRSGTDVPPRSPLLQQKFEEYLCNVYFAKFNPANPQGLSRNTVGHGVARTEDFNKKAAVLGLLILEQISYCASTLDMKMPKGGKEESELG